MSNHATNPVSPFQGVASARASDPLHNGTDRPLAPRELTAGEIKRGDIFTFFSPKENRTVTVHGPLQLALRLQLEFDPSVAAVTERPRSIPVGLDSMELHFWFQRRGGQEIYANVIPNSQTVPGVDGKRRPRELDRLRSAAKDAGISLWLITEDELKAPGGRNELCYQLLGFCQSAKDLGSSLALRQEIAATIERSGSISADELIHELRHHPRTHIQGVVAELLHVGFLATDAFPRMTGRSRIWRADP